MIYKITMVYLYIAFILLFNSCGEIIWFSDFPEPDLGTIKKVKLFLSYNNVQKLCESQYTDEYAPCMYEDSDIRIQAFIKIRGGISLAYKKKSYTTKIINEGNKKLYALDASYKDPSHIRNRLAMYTYRMLGLPAPHTQGVALFINDTYIGYYTRLEIYNEETLTNHYKTSCELYKIKAYDMSQDLPAYYSIEKKFPEDNNFSSFSTLIHHTKTMDDTSWIQWINEKINITETATYLAVHDFLAVGDTGNKNFYILHCGKYSILPWDNEHSMRRMYNGELFDSEKYSFSGDNILTQRLLMNGSPVRTVYLEILNEYFLDPYSDNYITDILIAKVHDYYDEIDKAVKNEPLSFKGYDEFIADKQIILNFLSERKDEVENGL